ncbi:MAG: hypothetical protein DMD87_19990 [Candidatus Rokuibacteriota bacterium]|nr:MAG: hypothetical protein DMD87_19990 [Candidatus Rokubacteria bacterium]
MKAIRTLVLVLLVSLAPSLGLAQQSASNAAPARPESERLRQELLALLVDVRSASAVLSAQSSYDEFMVKIGRIEKRLSSIRKKYQIPLSRGDHKALGAPISDACAALYAAANDWKQVRVAANEVAGAQRAVAHAAPWEVDFFQRQLQSAKVKQAEAQKHLTDHTATTLALVQAATRVQEASKKQAITVQK